MKLANNKHYLTGTDWIIHALDYSSKKETGIGNISQVVLELNGCLREEDVFKRLKKFLNNFSVLNGKCRRNYNLAPYWKIKPKKLHFSFDNISIKKYNFKEIISVLTQKLNQPLEKYLNFCLVNSQEKSFLAMTFDHRILDAKGAETFLTLLAKNDFEYNDFKEPSHLCKWQDKFKAGRCINRRFLSLAKGAPPQTLTKLNSERTKFSFKMITFNQKESAAIIDKAYKKAGYLLFMPYILSLVTKQIDKLFSAHDSKGKDYIISASIDKRNFRDTQQRLFFNHLSFLFFRISQKKAKDFNFVLKSIKDQTYSQISSKFADKFSEASFLMRIVPVSLLDKIIKLYFKGKTSSFGFSYIGESVYKQEKFMGIEVNNIFHMPRLPVPPGIGIFINQFQGKINIVLSYLSSLLDETHAERFMMNLKNDLLVKDE